MNGDHDEEEENDQDDDGSDKGGFHRLDYPGMKGSIK